MSSVSETLQSSVAEASDDNDVIPIGDDSKCAAAAAAAADAGQIANMAEHSATLLQRRASLDAHGELGGDSTTKRASIAAAAVPLYGHAVALRVPETIARRWIWEIARGVGALNEQGVFIGDLRPDNVLLGEGGHVALTHFSQWRSVARSIDVGAIERFYAAPGTVLIGKVRIQSCHLALTHRIALRYEVLE